MTAAVIQALQSRSGQAVGDDQDLPIEALDLLMCTAAEKAPVRIERDSEDVVVRAGRGHFLFGNKQLNPIDGRPDVIGKLLSLDLLKGAGDVLNVTPTGYALADDIVSANPSYTLVKAKCLRCSLHFIVCTEYPERHSARTLVCPECGQREGLYITWYQRMFGFIFQFVPGRQQRVAGTTIELETSKKSGDDKQ